MSKTSFGFILLLLAGLGAACSSGVTGSTPAPTTTAATPAAATEKPSAPSAPAKKEVAAAPETATTKEAAPDSEEEKIQFAKGATDATLERTIAPGVSKMYLMNARKGQTLWFKVTEPSRQIEVSFNKNPVKEGQEVRQSLNASGDWAIYVSNPTDAPLKYKLWVGIE